MTGANALGEMSLWQGTQNWLFDVTHCLGNSLIYSDDFIIQLIIGYLYDRLANCSLCIISCILIICFIANSKENIKTPCHWPWLKLMDSPHKGPLMPKAFSCDDVGMHTFRPLYSLCPVVCRPISCFWIFHPPRTVLIIFARIYNATLQ